MDIELFVNDLCPYCQRVVITARHLDIAHRATPINLASRPAWLAEVSPQSTVPALRADGVAIFDSSVINEFFNDLAQGTMLPDDPIAKGICRAWINHSGQCQTLFTQCCLAPDAAAFESARKALIDALDKFEQGPLQRDAAGFNGTKLSLVDVAMAPLFTRIAHLEGQVTLWPETGLERVRAWSERVRGETVVAESIPEKFALMFRMFLKNRAAGGYVATRLGVSAD
ncbi:MAG: glutathione S-transferase family protein [Magnetococcales bacterium]|nr:glutathione S-transferase family protein [Magnetococcales bacterium]